jgi:hypothetical protein
MCQEGAALVATAVTDAANDSNRLAIWQSALLLTSGNNIYG